jgi:hypothetical protein
MGILDSLPFDSASFQQASKAAPPGWLGLASQTAGASPGLAGAGQLLANASAKPTSASAPVAAPQVAAGNLLTTLLGGPGTAFSPAGTSSANGPSLGDRANAAVMNFLNGHGVLPAIGGAIAGATTGQRTDPVGLMQAHQASTVRALVGAGVAPDVAQAAAQNPDIVRLMAQLAGALHQHSVAVPALAALTTPAPAHLPSTGKTQKE